MPSISKNAQSAQNRYRLAKQAFFAIALALFTQYAVADAAAGQALTNVGQYLTSAVKLVLSAISAVVFVAVAWAVVTKFNDARRGRADWGEVIIPFVVGAAVVVFVGWLYTQGDAITIAPGGGA